MLGRKTVREELARHFNNKDPMAKYRDVETDARVDRWIGEHVEAFAEPIWQLAAGSDNLDEFQQRLSEALGDMEVGGVAEHLARAAFAARLAEETGADVTTEE